MGSLRKEYISIQEKLLALEGAIGQLATETSNRFKTAAARVESLRARDARQRLVRLADPDTGRIAETELVGEVLPADLVIDLAPSEGDQSPLPAPAPSGGGQVVDDSAKERKKEHKKGKKSKKHKKDDDDKLLEAEAAQADIERLSNVVVGGSVDIDGDRSVLLRNLSHTLCCLCRGRKLAISTGDKHARCSLCNRSTAREPVLSCPGPDCRAGHCFDCSIDKFGHSLPFGHIFGQASGSSAR